MLKKYAGNLKFIFKTLQMLLCIKVLKFSHRFWRTAF